MSCAILKIAGPVLPLNQHPDRLLKSWCPWKYSYLQWPKHSQRGFMFQTAVGPQNHLTSCRTHTYDPLRKMFEKLFSSLSRKKISLRLSWFIFTRIILNQKWRTTSMSSLTMFYRVQNILSGIPGIAYYPPCSFFHIEAIYGLFLL